MTIEENYIVHVESCFEKALKGQSKITDEIIAMEGMTGTMTRHFYNNLLSMDDARYLEIGVWRGSSCCSAMYGNKAAVSLLDDFSGFGGPKEEFMANLEKYRGDNDVTFYEEDCFKFDVSKLKNKFNIYLADGDHSADSHKRYLDHYISCLDDVFIYIVDDVNWKAVRDGTDSGIKSNNLEVIWKKEIRLTDDDQFTHNQEEAAAGFWNGISVFILKKTKNMTQEQIEQEYEKARDTPSDINQHLPILREYADQCESVVEFGVRSVVSTWAFLASKAKKVTSYDIFDVAVPTVKKFKFICADVLQIEIEPTDMLFIDTRHCYEQCSQELKLHAAKVKKFIAFHDTAKGTFGEFGDDGGRGLLFAINEFTDNNPEWKYCYHNEENNGMSILQKL